MVCVFAWWKGKEKEKEKEKGEEEDGSRPKSGVRGVRGVRGGWNNETGSKVPPPPPPPPPVVLPPGAGCAVRCSAGQVKKPPSRARSPRSASLFCLANCVRPYGLRPSPANKAQSPRVPLTCAAARRAVPDLSVLLLVPMGRGAPQQILLLRLMWTQTQARPGTFSRRKKAPSTRYSMGHGHWRGDYGVHGAGLQTATPQAVCRGAGQRW